MFTSIQDPVKGNYLLTQLTDYTKGTATQYSDLDDSCQHFGFDPVDLQDLIDDMKNPDG